MNAHSPEDLQRIYQTRFADNLDDRLQVWQVLIQGRFQRYVRPDDAVLDLGCGYGEFIKQIKCRTRYAMDLNPDVPGHVGPAITCLLRDCSEPWPLQGDSLDVVFTSNFFEHLPTKPALGRTLDEIHRCLKPGGRLIAMGPNIKYLPGAYWDFWDHHIPLTELSLRESLENRSFRIEECIAKFLPYTMARSPRFPMFFLKLYLQVPLLWCFFGKQFLLVARK